MYNLTMKEEVEDYLKKCEKHYLWELEEGNEDTAKYFLGEVERCKTILALYNEMKMYPSDWQEMKKIAEINRINRSMRK